MAKCFAAVILASCALAVSAEYYSHFGDDHGSDHHETKKDYNFDYTVHDPHHHLYNTHQESSKDGVVKGYYSLKDADGSLREVHYTADPKEGFKAIVTKNGVQVHPHTDGSSGHESSSLGHESSSLGHDSSSYGHDSSSFGHDGSSFGQESASLGGHEGFDHHDFSGLSSHSDFGSNHDFTAHHHHFYR